MPYITRFILWVRGPEENQGAWVHVCAEGYPTPAICAVASADGASRWSKEKDAEALALLLCTSYATLLHRIEVIEYPIGRKIHKYASGVRYHDFKKEL